MTNFLPLQPWPITGGECVSPPAGPKDLFITGHEDGSVRFWGTSGSGMKLLAKFSLNTLFRSDDDEPLDGHQDDDEEWPPFRKVVLIITRNNLF